MTSPDPLEQRLYAAAPSRGGAERLRIPMSAGTASRAIDGVEPAVYEGVRTFRGADFFALDQHLTRLQDAVASWDVPLEYDEDALVSALDDAARDATAAFRAEARIRFDVTLAPASGLGAASNLLFAITPFHGLARRLEREGARLRTAPGLARTRPEQKTSDFVAERARWVECHGRSDVDEYVLAGADGRILEGTQSNLIFVREGRLIVTPEGALPGVTQEVVVSIAAERGLATERRWTRASDLAAMDEAFMTTSVRGVIPVASLDGTSFRAPGAITAELRGAYAAFSEANAAPIRATGAKLSSPAPPSLQ